MDSNRNKFILLCILQISFVYCQQSDVVQLLEPKFQFIEPNGLEVSLEVPPHYNFDYILINGSFKCNNPVSKEQKISSGLNKENGRWSYEQFGIESCNSGHVIYNIVAKPDTKYNRNANIVELSGEEALNRYPPPLSKPKATKKDQPLLNLGGGLTDSLGLNVNLLGVVATENDKDNKNKNEHSSLRPMVSECKNSKTIVQGKSVCEGNLIFEDDFNNFNSMKWQHEIKIPLDTFDAEFVSYQGRSENLFVKNNKLHIVPSLLSNVDQFNENSIRRGILDLGEKCTGTAILTECERRASGSRILPPIVSAKIKTKDKFSFRYGKVEVRAKLPVGDWLFPQILLEPLTQEYGTENYASGQMRVAFIRGNEILDSKDGSQIDGYRLYGGAILSSGESFRSLWMKSTLQREHLGKNFHTYTLTWTDDSITLEVDGNIYGILRGNFKSTPEASEILHSKLWKNTMSPFDKEFYLSVGIAAGGISDFPDNCLNGPRRSVKPWDNMDPKNELKFWNSRSNWYQTWNEDDSKLIIDYIKVWAL